MHLANSLVWEAITGEPPPLPPPTAKTYTDQGLPWFDYYAEGHHALDGAETPQAAHERPGDGPSTRRHASPGERTRRAGPGDPVSRRPVYETGA